MDQQNTLKANNRISVNTPISSFLQMLMLLYLAVWSIAPPMEIGMVYRVVALVCAVGWLLFDLARGLKLQRIHIYAIGFVLLTMLIQIIQTEADFSQLMGLISFYILALAFIMNYSYQGRWDELHFIIPVFVILLIVFNIITFRELLIDPSLARKIVRADEEIYSYMRRGVGGYALIYSQVFLFPVMVTWMMRAYRKHKFYFLLGAVWIVSYILMILNAGYTTAIVVTIVSLFILLVYKRKSVIPALIISLAIIVLLVWLIGYVAPFREALLDFFDGTAVAKKVNDIYDSVNGKETADSISERIFKYQWSIQKILEFPFIGCLWFGNSGGHSALLDTFAKYGVWGGVMFINMFYCVPMQLKKETGDVKQLRVVNAFLVSLLIVMILDSLPYEIIFPVMIIAPILFNDIQKWRQENEGSLDRQPAAA